MKAVLQAGAPAAARGPARGRRPSRRPGSDAAWQPEPRFPAILRVGHASLERMRPRHRTHSPPNTIRTTLRYHGRAPSHALGPERRLCAGLEEEGYCFVL